MDILSVSNIQQRTALFLFAWLAIMGCPPAHAWHQEVTLQSQSSHAMVQFNSTGAISVLGVPTSDPGDAKVTLLDLDYGHLWEDDIVAFRLSNGQFLSVMSSGQVEATTLSLAMNPVTNLQDLAPKHRLKIVVREAGGPFCPGAFFIQEPVAANPFPAPQATKLVNDGCLVGFISEDGTRELVVNAANLLEMRPIAASSAGSIFRIRLRGLPPAQSLSAPFLETNHFLPFVVHVDHRRHEGGQGVRCEDSEGHAPLEANGRPCYSGHEGTDFIVRPIYGPGMTTPSIWAVAAAAGMVVGVANGNFDRCFFNPAANCTFIAPTPTSQPVMRCPEPGADAITCNGSPARADGQDTNKVMVLQDDGLVAEYVHLKNGTITVQEWERVECGQVLGLVGSSGISALPHLHFDLSKPPLPINIDRPRSEEDHSRMGRQTTGAAQGSPELVDPYDYHDANGRATLWAALPGNRRGALPELACHHPSQAQSDVWGGLSDGSPCLRNNQCRPNHICSSDGLCETHRQPGSSCQNDNDCAAFSRCEQQTCTRRGLAPGMRCGTGLICGPGLDCVNEHCTLILPPAPQPECPDGLSMKCPVPCSEINGACRRPPSGGTCPRLCLP